MERLFSPEEESPNPSQFWTAPLSLQDYVVTGAIGGDGIILGGGVGDVVGGGATNRALPEWSFQKFMDYSSLLDIDALLAPNQDTDLVFYPDPTTEVSRKWLYDVHEEEVQNMVEVIHAPPAPMAALDPVAYKAMLRRKLDADLATIALWRTSRGIRRQTSHGNRASQNPNGYNNLGSPNHIGDVVVHQFSSSSWEPSPSDEDMEGDGETTENMNVTISKVKKRTESNRDSARRSRSGKEAHMKELEEQVSLLRDENKSLMTRLVEVSPRYTNVVVDNRVLKANVETLETKVKMLEETMKRLTCTSNFPQDVSSISPLGISLSGSPLENISNTLLPTHDNPISYFATTTTDVGVNNNYIPESALMPMLQIHDPTTSLHMQPTVTLDRHQRRMCGAMPSASVPTPQWEATMLDQNDFVNIGM